jgi:ribosomal protein S18 acetylase RimI-like enzyme
MAAERRRMRIRQAREADYGHIIGVLDAWWAERKMTDMLPRLFFKHFTDTSFVIDEDGLAVAFLIGFVSPSDPGQAYVHFMGVDPRRRRQGLASRLYAHFFETVRARGCAVVRCLTSPVNTGSIAFHTRLGFAVEPGDQVVDGLAVHSDYDGPGEDRVLFVKRLSDAPAKA